MNMYSDAALGSKPALFGCIIPVCLYQGESLGTGLCIVDRELSEGQTEGCHRPVQYLWPYFVHL